MKSVSRRASSSISAQGMFGSSLSRLRNVSRRRVLRKLLGEVVEPLFHERHHSGDRKSCREGFNHGSSLISIPAGVDTVRPSSISGQIRGDCGHLQGADPSADRSTAGHSSASGAGRPGHDSDPRDSRAMDSSRRGRLRGWWWRTAEGSPREETPHVQAVCSRGSSAPDRIRTCDLRFRSLEVTWAISSQRLFTALVPSADRQAAASPCSDPTSSPTSGIFQRIAVWWSVACIEPSERSVTSRL